MENNAFDRLGIMIDNSRNAVMKPEAVKRMIVLMEKMGYNTLMLYTEDTYEVDNNPYFGHLRGRYSKEELKDLDSYAAEHNIELIPCIQTLAHLNALMRWPVYSDMRDCNDILCTSDERIYDLIDNMFSTIKQCFHTNLVNIGMDEAHFLGLGRYLQENGYQNRTEILLNHLKRVSDIARKYDFQLLMWGDMFIRLANGGNYDGNNLDSSVKEEIPDNVNIIYWDYYSKEKENYDRKIATHKKIKDNIWFAGGIWTWTGFTPHNQYSIEIGKVATQSCLENNVKNVIFTMWGDNGAECSRFSTLPAMYVNSQFTRGNFDMTNIKVGFYDMFGIDFDDYMTIDLTGTPNEINTCNPEKYMLYNDCMLGLFDCRATEGHDKQYAECAKRLEKMENHPEYGVIFHSARKLCEVLEIKYSLGVKTREAYLSGDKELLKSLLSQYDEVLQRLEAFYQAYEKQWMAENKPHGFDVQDIRIGGLMLRVRHTKQVIKQYIDGELDRIEELEEPVLEVFGGREVSGNEPTCFNLWEQTATANVI